MRAFALDLIEDRRRNVEVVKRHLAERIEIAQYQLEPEVRCGGCSANLGFDTLDRIV
jgi:hypothetical protein